MSGMRARGWRSQGGAMAVTLGVRPGQFGQMLLARGVPPDQGARPGDAQALAGSTAP
jgi:hypothetical protein